MARYILRADASRLACLPLFRSSRVPRYVRRIEGLSENTDMTTSHSTRLPKDASQVAGYRHERDLISAFSSCGGWRKQAIVFVFHHGITLTHPRFQLRTIQYGDVATAVMNQSG